MTFRNIYFSLNKIHSTFNILISAICSVGRADLIYKIKYINEAAMELSTQARNLLALLVARLDAAVLARPETFIGYKECHDILGLQRVREKWGESLKVQGLQELAEWTVICNLPAITGLVIDRGSLEPGIGYFDLPQIKSNPYVHWNNEINSSKQFDWSPFVSTPVFHEPIDFNVPPRQNITTSRIIRDTALSLVVKFLNDYKCQICGITIALSGDKKYIEAHHIKPLGQPHNGPDTIENLICVCPNHHAMLDYGAMMLVPDTLSQATRHRISNEYIAYHNDVIFEK